VQLAASADCSIRKFQYSEFRYYALNFTQARVYPIKTINDTMHRSYITYCLKRRYFVAGYVKALIQQHESTAV